MNILTQETVKPRKPYQVSSPIPSQSEIRERMLRLYSNKSKLLESIISPCAEEAERILCDLLTSSVEPHPVVVMAVRHTGSRHLFRMRETGYKCPKCNYEHLRYNSNYCPGCGKPIEWK